MATSSAQASRAWLLSRPSPGARDVGLPVLSRLYHFNLAGFAYAATTCVLLIGAINGQNNLLFALFGLAVGGLVISGVLSGWSLMGLRVEREIIDPGHAGGTLRLRYRVTNTNRIFGAFGLVLEELPSARTLLAKKHSANLQGRTAFPKAYVAYVGPRSSTFVETEVPAFARGQVVFGPVRVMSTFPFGLTRKSVTYVGELVAWIRPARVALQEVLLPTTPAMRPMSARAQRASIGADFYALRAFQPGDSLRSIAWRATARADEPIVRVYADRPGRSAWILLDDVVVAGSELARERAIAVACEAAAQLHVRGFEVGLASTTRGILVQPRRSQSQAVHVAEVLARLDDGQEGSGSLDELPIHSIQLRVEQGGAAGTHGAALRADDPGIYLDGALPAVDFRPSPDVLGVGA